jgi:hypothetical protein
MELTMSHFATADEYWRCRAEIAEATVRAVATQCLPQCSGCANMP